MTKKRNTFYSERKSLHMMVFEPKQDIATFRKEAEVVFKEFWDDVLKQKPRINRFKWIDDGMYGFDSPIMQITTFFVYIVIGIIAMFILGPFAYVITSPYGLIGATFAVTCVILYLVKTFREIFVIGTHTGVSSHGLKEKEKEYLFLYRIDDNFDENKKKELIKSFEFITFFTKKMGMKLRSHELLVGDKFIKI